MNVGDKVKFSFAKKDKEGIIARVFPKTVYIRADFPKEKGKIIKRKLQDIKA